MGYHYDLKNCLFNYALYRILKECGCRPHFMPAVASRKVSKEQEDDGDASATRPFCTGAKLRCMHDIVQDIEGEDGTSKVVSGHEGEPDAVIEERVNRFRKPIIFKVVQYQLYFSLTGPPRFVCRGAATNKVL